MSYPTWLETTLVHLSSRGGIYVVRFLKEPADRPDPPIGGVCTTVVVGDQAVIHGMLGTVTRKHLREFMAWLRGMGVKILRAKRTTGHILPGAREEGDWKVIDLVALDNRHK